MNTDLAAKMILMLSSDNDNEVLVAARKLKAMDLHKIAEIVRGNNNNPYAEIIQRWEFATRQAAAKSPPKRKTKVDRYAADVLRVSQEFQNRCPFAEIDESSIGKFVRRLPMNFILDAVQTASERMSSEEAFRYFCGICWREIREREEESA